MAARNLTEGKASLGFPLLITGLYALARSRRVRAMLRRLALRLEGGAMYSLTVRGIYRRFHNLDVGLYTIGPCEAGPDLLDSGTTIGRYCSIYYTVRTITRDYPAFANARHGLFFDPALGLPPNTGTPETRLEIGHDVFIGHNSVILPTARSIGDGAFIGAGSVVQSPVPPYAVVMGNPARVVRYRFSEPLIKELLESKWWLKAAGELTRELADFRRPLEGDAII